MTAAESAGLVALFQERALAADAHAKIIVAVAALLIGLMIYATWRHPK